MAPRKEELPNRGTREPGLANGPGIHRDWLFPGDPILATGGVGNVFSTVDFDGPISNPLVIRAGPPPKWPG
ncbi:hypothetical protein FNYG_04168 [Fusarium nygamai]|uniref:Uncharacterized protein n=1 Tax=Gibberella nygamai TaxID=42673 RepID=A0A2K0WJK6_GIBNY|nr:hypothetical protein FNYG_04168 [Fusarium nygamai]